MTKKEFLKQLESELSALKKAERNDILNDYKEHFVAGYEVGKSDDEIIMALGRPEDISQEILEISQMEAQGIDTQQHVGAFICILIFHGLIGFWIFLSIVLAIVSMFFVGIVMLVSPILYVVGIPWQGFNWFEFFLGLIFSGSGYFMTFGMWHLGKIMRRFVVNHIKYLANLVTGGAK